MRSRKQLTILSALFAMVLISSSCQPQPSESLAQAQDDTALEHAEKHADPNYVCPMHPQIVRGEPGSCPICGMDLVPVELEADSGDDFPAVTVSSQVVQNMGIRTARAESKTLWRYIRTIGNVGYDEDRLSHIHSRSSGWVEQLKIGSLGQVVTKGEVLLRYYSPEIYAAQEELLLALKSGQGLLRSARDRLRLLDVPEAVIKQIEKQRKPMRSIPIYAAQSGVVVAMGLREGMYIEPALELYSIANLDEVWVEVDVFERQFSWLEIGRTAEISVAAMPGRLWEGEVEYIYPELNPITRTLRVRLSFPNEDGALKPNMFAEAAIFGGPRREVLSVPREAVIFSGEKTRVIKQLENNDFQPVLVTTGMETDDLIEIMSGLELGDQIVVSGQFMIDSESNLRASLQRFSAGE